MAFFQKYFPAPTVAPSLKVLFASPAKPRAPALGGKCIRLGFVAYVALGGGRKGRKGSVKVLKQQGLLQLNAWAAPALPSGPGISCLLFFLFFWLSLAIYKVDNWQPENQLALVSSVVNFSLPRTLEAFIGDKPTLLLLCAADE